jgi:PAT family beta-lactamase induction signal transducer AmpG
MLIGITTTFVIDEPDTVRSQSNLYSTFDYLRFLSLFAISIGCFIGFFYFSSSIASELKEALGKGAFANFLVESMRLIIALASAICMAYIAIALGVAKKGLLQESYSAPIKDFFSRYNLKIAASVLAIIALYRVSDIVLGVITNVFYLELGFSKIEIATISKTFGLLMSIAGGFLGGLLAVRYGVIRMLLIGALLSALTNLLFAWLASIGNNIPMLYVVISVDNLSAGLAVSAFVAFLSQLTNISFTAVQYAIFSSLMTLLPKLLGGYSGSIVETMGYNSFFILTALMGLPVLLLIYFTAQHLELE